MNQDTVVGLANQAMTLALEVGGPILLLGLIVGLAVSLFQAVTSLQEQTLSFIPKIVALALLISLAGPWMLGQLVHYTTDLWQQIPQMVSP